jgi:hypothetical protein
LVKVNSPACGWRNGLASPRRCRTSCRCQSRVNSGLPSSSSAISAETSGSSGVSAASERRWAAIVSAERSQSANSSLAAGWKNVYRIVLRCPGGQSARPGAGGYRAGPPGWPAANLARCVPPRGWRARTGGCPLPRSAAGRGRARPGWDRWDWSPCPARAGCSSRWTVPRARRPPRAAARASAGYRGPAAGRHLRAAASPGGSGGNRLVRSVPACLQCGSRRHGQRGPVAARNRAVFLRPGDRGTVGT